MYEQQGKPVLGFIPGASDESIEIIDENAERITVHVNRISVLGPADLTAETAPQALKKLRKDSYRLISFKDIARLWEKLSANAREHTIEELAQSLFDTYTLPQIAALRFTLLEEKVYFKRKKNLFIPRSPALVAQSRSELDKERDQKRMERDTIEACKKKILDPTYTLSWKVKKALYPLKCLAAAAKRIPQAQQKEARRFFNELKTELGIPLEGSTERQVYSLLRKLGEFDSDTNLALFRHNVQIQFRKKEKEAAAKVIADLKTACADYSEDLTDRYCITIDDEATQDMDDAISIQQTETGFELGIHISNIAGAIPFKSPLEHTARKRGTSLYLTDRVIPMLPEELSSNYLSLVAGEERYTISILFQLDSAYTVISSRITPAKIKVSEKCSYTFVDQQLEHSNGDLFHLYQIACSLEADRFAAGGFKVPKRDAMIRVLENGTLQLEEVDENSPARMVIGELMILANKTFAQYAAEKAIPLLFRTQPGPDESKLALAESLPDGLARDYTMRTALRPSSTSFSPGVHSTLGISAYAQVTSPIRRYGDLCNQRQILNALLKQGVFFEQEKFQKIMAESDAHTQYTPAIIRETRRFWFLRYLQQEKKNIKHLQGTVLRNDMKNPMVQLHDLFLPVLLQTNTVKQVGDVLTLQVSKLSPTFDEVHFEEV